MSAPSITVLRARDGKFMAKRISQNEKGYEITSYDEAFEYDLTDLGDLAPGNIEELSNTLTVLESDPHRVVIRGRLADGINPDWPVLRRIKAKGGHPIYFVEREDGVPFAMVDFDKLQAPPGLSSTGERLAWLISLLPPEFADVSYHFQSSSSAGLFGADLISAHLFYWLATPRTDSEMKEWGDWLNSRHLLAPDVVAEDVKRPKIIDPSVFISNQPNYTAAPVFLNGAVDPFAAGGRSGLVRKGRDVVEIVMPQAGELALIKTIQRDLRRKNHQHNAAISGGAVPTGTGFDDKLAAIGAPSFNKPICSAMAAAVLLRGTSLDEAWLKEQIRACVDANYAFGRQGEMERYKSDGYLDEVIGSALAQFGRSDMERIHDRLRYQEKLREDARRDTADSPFFGESDDGLDWNLLDEECGAGKSHHFRDMIMTGMANHYLIGVDKIERIDEVKADLKGHHFRSGGFEFHDAFSGKENDDGEVRNVIGQLKGIRGKIDGRRARNANYRSVTFVTHAAITMMEWAEWDDHVLIVDEKLPVWACDEMQLPENFDLIERVFEVDEVPHNGFVGKAADGDRYLLKLTDYGRSLGEKPCADDVNKRFWLLANMAVRGRHVWVNRAGWESRGDSTLQFFAIVLPDAYRAFQARWMAGDYIVHSLLYRLWEQHGVAWTRHRIANGRKRRVPLAERGVVYYFMTHGASFQRFNQPDFPLNAAAAYIAAKHNEVLWTVNSRFAKKMPAIFSGDGTGHCFVTPRQTGTERYKTFDVAFWGAAIQAPQFEANLVRDLVGMSRAELDLDREYDAMNQFLLRTKARDYDSDEPFVWYVMSEAQAKYINERYGIPMHHIPGVIEEGEVKNGRPKSDKPMTASERQKARRDRLRAQGFSARGKIKK